MGFIKNNATTLKQVKIGTDTSKIHYIKRNGSIEWAKPYNLTIVNDTEEKLKNANLASLSVYRKSTKVSSGVTSGTSATLTSGKQVFHGDVLHIDATAVTGYHIIKGTGDIKVEGDAIVQGAVTVNPQAGRTQYKFKFEPRLITGASSWLITSEDQIKSYTSLTDTTLKLPIPVGYDDNAENRTCNKKVNAMGGSLDVLYQGYLFYPNFLNDSLGVIPAEYNTLYPEVKQTNRIMYVLDPGIWPGNTEDKDDDGNFIGKVVRIPVDGITTPVYFHKMVGTILKSEQPIPLEITTPGSLLKLSALGSNDINTSKYTVNGGSSIVLWSDVVNGYPVDGYPKGTTYKCTIPSSQQNYWTFDSGNNPSGVTSKVVNLASWDNTTGFNESDIPTTANIPNVYQKLYNVTINVESSINKVILNSADLSTGYLFLGINGSWQPITSPTMSFSLPYGTTIQLAKNHNSNMPGFIYESVDHVHEILETKNITVNGTTYLVDVYSVKYTVNVNNKNIPFYVTPNSYTITCNIGMGISSFNFSTTSKYGTAFSNQSYSSNRSFEVYYKDTCSYNGVVKTGFENATPSASNAAVSTKTVTFTASPKLFRVTVSTVGEIKAEFNRTSSPYKGAATGKLTSGYNSDGKAFTDANAVFYNKYSFDAYYGDVISCDPAYLITPIGEYSTYVDDKYLSYTTSMTITGSTTWSINTKKITVSLRLTNSNFLNGNASLYVWHDGSSKRISLSAGTTSSQTIDAGTTIHVAAKQKNSQYCQLKVAEKAYSTSLTSSDFTKTITLSSSESFVSIVSANTKSSNFSLTFAPALRYTFSGYGINVNVTKCEEIQMNGSSQGATYSMIYNGSHSGGYGGTSSKTYIYIDCILLRSSSSRISVTMNYYAEATDTFFSNNPSKKVTSTSSYTYGLTSSDSSCPSLSTTTYGPYARLFVIPYFYCSYYYWGSHRYYTYYDDGRYIRTYRKAYGTSGTPGIGYNATGTGTISGFSKSHLYYKGSSGKADNISAYLKSGSVVSLYDSIYTSLSRPKFLSSSDGNNHSSDLSGDMKNGTFYAIMDFNSTSNQILSDIKSAMNGSYKYIIDYVMDYSEENY